jgi:hypothetical protein
LTSEHNTADPLDGVTVEGGRIVFGAAGAPGDDIEAGGVTVDRLREIYDAGKFTDHIRRVLAWGGRRYDYKSLQIPADDQAFADACEVAYRRLADGPAAAVLQWIGNDLLIDLFVIAAGFGPVVQGVATERREKAEAKRMAAARAAAESAKPDAPGPAPGPAPEPKKPDTKPADMEANEDE